MCCILPWKVTKLSVLSRWYWICSITGKKMLCRGMVYLGTFSRNLDEFRLPEGTAPFGWVAPGTVSSPPAPRSPEPPLLGVQRLGGPGQHQPGPVCCPHTVRWALFISGWEEEALWESLSWFPPSRDLSLPAGCCWAGTWSCEAVLALGPALPCCRGPGCSRLLLALQSAGKEAHTAEAGKVLRDPGSLYMPQEPSISFHSPPLPSLPPSAAWTPWAFSYRVYMLLRVGLFCGGAESLAVRGRMGTSGAWGYRQDFWLWG